MEKNTNLSVLKFPLNIHREKEKYRASEMTQISHPASVRGKRKSLRLLYKVARETHKNISEFMYGWPDVTSANENEGCRQHFDYAREKAIPKKNDHSNTRRI